MQRTVRPLDAEVDRDIEAHFQVHAEVMARDVPDLPQVSRGEHVGRLRYPRPGNRSHHWLAFDDPAAEHAAAAMSVDMPQLDNTTMADVYLAVHPDHRRRGLARVMYAKAVDFARENKRTVLMGEYHAQMAGGPERGPAPAAFAAAMGTKVALVEIGSRLDLDTVDRGAWIGLQADARAHAAGYSTVAWTDAAPDDVVGDLAALESRFLLDVPTGDLMLEPENVDVARMRASEETDRLRRRRNYHVGACQDATGQLVAWTLITVEDGNLDHAHQQITIVDRAHRGHRLGMLVKIENLLRTVEAEPAMRHIQTYNAEVNAHMIAINEGIGFRPVDRLVCWQQEI